MTLILTTTCDYALLVAIAEGTGFPSCSDRDIFLYSRLALHLPDTVGDLIPPTTIISTKPAKLDSTPQWRTTLVYFLSAKLLKRLKRRRAQVTIQAMTMTEWGDMDELGSVELRVDHAKTIKVTQRQQRPPLNILKNYVIDKGDWKPIIGVDNTTMTDGARIKVGLFVVEMSVHAGDRYRETLSVRPSQPFTFTKQLVENNDLGLEIHSTDSNDGLTGNSLPSMDDTINNEHSKISTESIPSQNIASASPSFVCFRVMQRKSGPFPYLQIGNGSQRYTFVLRLVEATSVMTLIPTNDPSPIIKKSIGHSDNSIRKWMQYTFSDWQVKHDVITKGNSWLVTDQPMCLSLQGHLHDLQHWLSQQGQIEVCLVLADELGKCEHTIGKSMVRLKGWCPLGMEQASFPIHDRSNRLHVDQPFQFARVVVQLGLVEGWQNYLNGQQLDISLVNSSSSSSLVQQQHSFLHQQNLIK